MDSKSIYTKLTYNIEKNISRFKEGKLTSSKLEEQLIINISSLCNFLNKREQEKQQCSDKDNMNETILDVFVPFSRLSTTLQKKLESLNILEPKEFERDLELDGDPFLEENDLFEEKTLNKDFTSLIDADTEYMDNKQTTNYLDDTQSLSMSLFNQPIDSYDPFAVGKGMHDTYKQQQHTSSSIVGSNGKGNLFYQNINASVKESEIRFSQLSQVDQDKKEEIKTALNEFKGILKDKVIEDTVKEMSLNYLRYMYDIYKRMKSSCDLNNENEYISLSFINQFKSFVLEIGISDKKFYEQCIREIIYNKNMFEFSEFLDCFRKLLNLKFDQTFLKYKCKYKYIQ
jgi:hypothetical protein